MYDYPISELNCGSDNNFNYHPPRLSLEEFRNENGQNFGELPPDYVVYGGRQKKLSSRRSNKIGEKD